MHGIHFFELLTNEQASDSNIEELLHQPTCNIEIGNIFDPDKLYNTINFFQVFYT